MRININFSSKEHLYYRKVYLALVLCICLGVLIFVRNYNGYREAVRRTAHLTGQSVFLVKRNAEISEKLAGVKKTLDPEQVKATALQADFANSAIKQRVFSWTAFLNRLEEVVPDGVGITSVRPNFATLDVEISGTALDIGRVTEFVERLTKSRYFEDIPPVFHTDEVEVDKDIGKTIQSFGLKIRYNPVGADKPGTEKTDEKKLGGNG